MNFVLSGVSCLGCTGLVYLGKAVLSVLWQGQLIPIVKDA